MLQRSESCSMGPDFAGGGVIAGYSAAAISGGASMP